MKANKFVAIALSALTLVGFNACKEKENPDNGEKEATLTLDKTSINLEVDQEETVTATIAVEWETSNPQAATVTPANDGKSAKVVAVAEGSAVITAKSKGGQTKTCVVAVKKAGGQTGAQLKGSQVWPIILDGVTYAANESKVVASFQPNDVDQFLYVWNQTYIGGTASGLNFHGNTEGYTALVVNEGNEWVATGNDWSGAGFCLTDAGEGWKAAEALRAAIVAAPDDYFLHIAIKSTDNYSHCFYIFGAENTTKFILGSKVIYDGTVYKDFTRDGSWQEFDIPMSAYATALSQTECVAGVNLLCVLTEGVPGAQLNLDAVYFYKK